MLSSFFNCPITQPAIYGSRKTWEVFYPFGHFLFFADLKLTVGKNDFLIKIQPGRVGQLFLFVMMMMMVMRKVALEYEIYMVRLPYFEIWEVFLNVPQKK